MKKENIILVDFNTGENWRFANLIEKYTKEKWTIKDIKANGAQDNIFLKIINVYSKYFTFPFKVFLERKKYKNVLAWQQFFGLILAFYCRIFRVKNYPKITIMTFIYKEKKLFFKTIYFSFIKYIVTSKYIDKLICFSESEIEYYKKIFNLSDDKIKYCVYGEGELIEKSNRYEEGSEKFLLSVGRSNRDYTFLVDCIKDTKYKLTIICDNFRCKNYKNIKVENNVYGSEYLNILKKCHMVIIPLADENISSGQLVLLKAMEYGKPVIITKNNTINSYILNGYNGIIINKSRDDLEEAIEFLENPDNYKRLSDNAVDYFNKSFTVDAFAKSIAGFIDLV